MIMFRDYCPLPDHVMRGRFPMRVLRMPPPPKAWDLAPDVPTSFVCSRTVEYRGTWWTYRTSTGERVDVKYAWDEHTRTVMVEERDG